MTVDAKEKKREPIVFPVHLKETVNSTGPARVGKRAWPEEKYNVKLPSGYLEDPHTHRFKRNKSASSIEAKDPEKGIGGKPAAAPASCSVPPLASSPGNQQVPRIANGSKVGKKPVFQKQKARQGAPMRGKQGHQHRVIAIAKQKGHRQGASPQGQHHRVIAIAKQKGHQQRVSQQGRSRKPHQGPVQAKQGHAPPSQPKGSGRQKEKTGSASQGDLDLDKRISLSLDALAKLNKKKGKAAKGSGKGH